MKSHVIYLIVDEEHCLCLISSLFLKKWLVSLLRIPFGKMIVSLLFPGDGLWYRGKVSKLLDEQTVEVFYLDFGNYETVELGKLKLLKEEWASLAAEAVQCSIPRICPVRGTQWSSITIERFNNVTAHKQLVGKIMKLGEKRKLFVNSFSFAFLAVCITAILTLLYCS